MYNKYNWRFDNKIVGEFDKHVRQSVPLYEMFHKSIVDISKYYIRRNTDIIDVGTSTGFFIKSIYDERTKINRNNKHIGVDIEQAMIDECKKRYKDCDIEFILSDAVDVDYKNASVITMILMLQFLEKKQRIALLQKIYDSVDNETALFVVEKIKTDNINIHDIYGELYYDFKKKQGLTSDEILSKNESLRGVMKSITLNESLSIFNQIGFKTDINVKYNNFVSIVAIK